MSNSTHLCHHFDDEVEERRTLAGNDPNGEFQLKITRNGGFLPALMTPTWRISVQLQVCTWCFPLIFGRRMIASIVGS